MAGSDKQKQSLYFPEETLAEIMKEAIRLDRSLSWTVQQAWRVAREEVKKFPSVGWRSDGDRPTPAPVARERPASLPIARERQASPPVERPALDDRAVEPSSQLREFLKGKFDRETTR